MDRIRVYDGVLEDPLAYRAAALAAGFQSIPLGGSVFHGIGASPDATLPEWIGAMYPGLEPVITFFRHSPGGQREPNYVHSDTDMGDWTGILYLNPDPPLGDGTLFYAHTPTGDVESTPGVDTHADEWSDPSKWTLRGFVPAAFNRLVLFPSRLFHSRAIPENYGAGNDARLIQVVFGRGELPA